ncbi:MAG: hypothetical protein E6Q27_06325 [Aeromicrobium sp.]|nr:MAG: hypothetical protein E6Q27_06325 [Aeromicrobium sp.]
MAVFKKRTKHVVQGAGVHGPVRLVSSLGDLSGVRAGDIVLIEQEDIDIDSAQKFVSLNIAALVNSFASVTGQEPAKGAAHLVESGILLLDEVGTGVWSTLRNGDLVRIDGNEIHRDDEVLATGVLQTAARVAERQSEATSGISNRLDSVVTNAADLVRRERAMLIDGERIPRLATPIQGRPVVLVAAHDDAKQQLRQLRKFIVDHDPVIIAISEGADVVQKAGYGIDVLMGHAEELAQSAITKSKEIVLVSSDGRWERPERFEKHGTQPVLFTAPGNAENLAILLADHHDAAAIILVGYDSGITELTGHDPVDVAGNLVARLSANTKIIDARAVEYFARRRIGIWVPLLLLLMGCLAVYIALDFASTGEPIVDWFTLSTDSLLSTTQGTSA